MFETRSTFRECYLFMFHRTLERLFLVLELSLTGQYCCKIQRVWISGGRRRGTMNQMHLRLDSLNIAQPYQVLLRVLTAHAVQSKPQHRTQHTYKSGE